MRHMGIIRGLQAVMHAVIRCQTSHHATSKVLTRLNLGRTGLLHRGASGYHCITGHVRKRVCSALLLA